MSSNFDDIDAWLHLMEGWPQFVPLPLLSNSKVLRGIILSSYRRTF